ncbi:MAG: hypothetical protein IAE90_10470 [Ignavibacteria bacterium]|nr:hypothetical protein [Ignavibacteria bacterium]
MEKRITTSFIFFLLLSIINISFGQDLDDKNYSSNKEKFYKQYLIYKSNLANGIVTVKPIDPSGLFAIDEKSNFVPVDHPADKTTDMYSQVPWINGQPDVVTGYTWTQPAGTYTTISGGAGTVILASGAIDDNVYGLLPIGFTFNFDGVDYTQFGLCANGWIALGSGTPTNTYTPMSGTTRNIIAVMAQDLLGQATGKIEYQTSGTAPNRVLTIQWSTWAFYNSGVVDGSTLNFQVKLYETTNNVQLIYGTNTQSAINHTVQVGLGGATTADFNNRTTTTNWAATTAGTLNSDACTMTSAIVPALNLTFQWAPPAASPMTYVSSTTAQVTPGLNIPQSSINNQIVQIQVVMTGTQSPINLTSLNFNTTGSTNPADFANAKVYYTGTSNVFATTTVVGTTVSPSGTFAVTGSQPMSAGTNYFWLTYDATAGAVQGDYVDAQTVSIIGSGSMGTQTPTITDPAGRRQIDNYCRGTFSNNGCLGTGIYITNLTIGNINNTSTCDPDANFPYAYSWFGNLTASLEQGVTYPVSASTFSSSNPQGFAIWIDWDNNNSFDAGEYTSFPIITTGSPVVTSAFITVPPGASVGNHRMRLRNNLSSAPTSVQPCALLSYGETEDYTVNVTAAAPMVYTSSTVTQNNVTGFSKPSLKTEVIGIQVVTTGSLTPLSITSFTLNTNGSTNAATDITNAKLWSTGLVNSFAATAQYGAGFSSPNGTFVINGSQTLLPGTNYFWLTYDVPISATTNDVIDAECTALNVVTPRTPTVTAPSGNRLIGASRMSGVYTIPGSYPNFNTAIADLNARGTMGPVTFNVSSGFIDTAANLVLTTTGTVTNPIIFQRFGAAPLPNPVITAGVGTSTTTDGIIKLNGADYITFDGIDLMENPANTTPTTQMEWGYALVKPDGSNGCQNVVIKNCSITLNKTNVASVGIYSGNHSPASTGTFTVTSTNGANSNNSFTGVTITNAYVGIYFSGYSDATPFAFYDQNNSVNNCNITNYGGTSTTAYGIYSIYQNGLVLNGNTINSTGGVNSSGTLYGVFCSTMSNSDLTISNNTVTIAAEGTSSSIYGISFGNSSAGTSNNINILNNNIQNCTYLTATSGSMYGLYCNAASNNLVVSGNRLVGNIYGGAASTGTTIYSIYTLSSPIRSYTLTNNLDSGNVVNGTTAYSTYRMYSSITTQNVVITGNKVKNNTICGTTATGTSYGIYNTAGTFTCNMSNNEVSNNVSPSTSSSVLYCMYNSSTAPVSDYNSNLITGNTSSGTGAMYGIYYTATPASGSTENMNNNTVTNLTKLTATGTGTIYGIYHSGSGTGTVNMNGNTVTGFTSAAATGYYGIYQIGSPPNYVNFNNNKVGNFTNGGVSTIYGIYNNPSATSIVSFSQDSIFNITSPGSTIYGMYSVNGSSVNINRNRINGLTSNTSTSATVSGLYISGGVTTNVYNNIITDLNSTASTSIAPAVTGLYISGGTYVNAYYNTIFLKAVSSSVTTFGTAGVYASTTPIVDLRNNVIVNLSTPGATGGNTAAYRRSSNLLTSYSANSNNNCFYAGTPSTAKLIFFDGTNSDQTLAAYKTRVNPKDNASATENPPFVNSVTAPYDLRVQTSVATVLESGGIVIATPLSITNDAFGTARYPNSGYPVGGFTPIGPDMGAHEFGGLNSDNAAPYINYTALGNGGTSNRAFNNVIITDASGVNTTAGTRPRVYYKRSIDGNVINDNTSGTDGWKWVEANGTTSPFDFTIDYTKLNGGTGAIAGQTIQYFVIAQDLVVTPNLGWNQATFTTAPTTVALVAGSAPISNTLSYLIGTNTFSGSYNVGASQTYSSLTGAGGLFAALNAGTLTGNITALITSDMIEDGTNSLNITNETGPGGYTIRIVPSDATPKLISGSVAQGMIRLNGSRRVTIDGNNGLGSKYLTFRNTNGLYPTFVFLNEAGKDSLKNCIIESNNASVSTTQAGTILFSTTTGLMGNDSNVIAGCDIRDRSDATGYPAFGIYNNGTTTTIPQYNSYNVVTGNNIYNYFLDAASFTGGVFLNTGNTDWIITGNSFYQTGTRTVTLGATFAAIYNNNSTNNNNNQITNNYVGGSAPLCAGTAMTYTGAGLYSFFGIQAFVSVLTPTNITGNTIKNINLTTSPATGTSAFFKAIYAQTGWINVNNNIIGATTGNDNITLTTNTTATAYIISIIHHVGFGSVNDNTLGSITFGGTSIATADNYYGINYSNTTAGQTYSINNNLIGSLTTPNSIQQTKTVTGTAFRGILLANGAGTTNNITNNTIANITDLSTSTVNTVSVYGISNSGAGNYNFAGNTIRNLTNNCNVPSASFLLGGIFSTGAGINTYTQNNIYTLYALGTGSGAQLVGGILAGGTTGGTVSKNKIFDFRHLGTGVLAPAPLLLGFNVQSSGPYNINNNMVSLTNGDPTDDPDYASMIKAVRNTDNKVSIPEVSETPLLGLKDKEGFASEQIVKEVPLTKDDLDGVNDKGTVQSNVFNKKAAKNEPLAAVNCAIAGVYHTSSSPGPCNYYYNSFYIGGTQPSGTYSSWAYVRTSTGAVSFKNNLFVNARTGGAGNQYVIGNEAANPLIGWLSTSSDYNVYLGTNANTMGEWGLGNAQSLDQWVASSNGDKQSWSTTTSVVNPTNLFTSISTCNLSILTGNTAAWLVSGKGIALTGYNTDYTGDTRVTTIPAGVTDIGADEFTATPPSNPVATQVGTPGAGATTNYVLYGRKICSIDWGTGGTYPTSVNVNYFSGISPLAPNVTNPNRTSVSYWTATPVGTFSGTTYDATWYYGDNETYSITSPASNVLLAKNDVGFWMTYPQGIGNLQSELTPSALSVKVSGLLRFSSFTLSDAALPAEFPKTPLNNAIVTTTSPTLIWSKSLIAATYRVQIATDSLFNTIILNDSTVTDTTKPVTGLVNNTNYWWRVNGKNGTGTGAWSQVFKFTVNTVLPPAVVNLTVIPGGFYDSGSGRLNMRDTIRVYLVDSVSCVTVDSAKSTVDSVTFGANISFSNAATGNYYMLVYHRNHLAVATRYRATVTRGSTVNYDFTTDSTKAFGFNMIKVSTSPVRWAMIPGDANRDGFVDAIDQTIWIAQNGLDGYLSADFNGDLFVDAIDQAIWILYNGTSSFLPCGFSFEAATDRVILNTPDFDAKKNSALIREKKKMLEPVKTDVKKDNNRK